MKMLRGILGASLVHWLVAAVNAQNTVTTGQLPSIKRQAFILTDE